MNADMSFDELKKRLSYDPFTGTFTWLVSDGGRRIGATAGTSVSGGYISIGIKGKYYKAHRLAWLYVYGEWPSGLIDHIDGNPSNNGLSNLREASPHQNLVNYHRQRQNKTGFRGVTEACGRYVSVPVSEGKRFPLGTFPTATAAHEAYLKFRKEKDGAFFAEIDSRVPKTQEGGAN